MNTKTILLLSALAIVGVLFVTLHATADEPSAGGQCPLTGMKASGDHAETIDGKSVNMCCGGCAPVLRAHPELIQGGAAPLAEEVVVEETESTTEEAKPQTTCPIMGGAINPNLYVDVNGYRIFVCCPPCKQKILADPEAAIATIREAGQEPMKTPAEEE